MDFGLNWIQMISLWQAKSVVFKFFSSLFLFKKRIERQIRNFHVRTVKKNGVIQLIFISFIQLFCWMMFFLLQSLSDCCLLLQIVIMIQTTSECCLINPVASLWFRMNQTMEKITMQSKTKRTLDWKSTLLV